MVEALKRPRIFTRNTSITGKKKIRFKTNYELGLKVICYKTRSAGFIIYIILARFGFGDDEKAVYILHLIRFPTRQ